MLKMGNASKAIAVQLIVRTVGGFRGSIVIAVPENGIRSLKRRRQCDEDLYVRDAPPTIARGHGRPVCEYTIINNPYRR
jgi:hypothetical protein